MPKKPYKTETKGVVTVRLYPSEREKAKRLGASLSHLLSAAIAALPEEPQQEENAE